MVRSALVLLLATVLLNFAAGMQFSCGSNRFQHLISHFRIGQHCAQEIDAFDQCCRTHDDCYNAQTPRRECDEEFCDCLNEATLDTEKCRMDAKAFCKVSKIFGDVPYAKAAKAKSHSWWPFK